MSQLTKYSVTVRKGKLEGDRATPVYGGKLRFIGLPVNSDGTPALSGQSISFHGCFGGDAWFRVMDYNGRVVKIATRAEANPAHIPNYLAAAPIMLPIQDPSLFEGINFLIPVLDRAEEEDKTLDLYCESTR